MTHRPVQRSERSKCLLISDSWISLPELFYVKWSQINFYKPQICLMKIWRKEHKMEEKSLLGRDWFWPPQSSVKMNSTRHLPVEFKRIINMFSKCLSNLINFNIFWNTVKDTNWKWLENERYKFKVFSLDYLWLKEFCKIFFGGGSFLPLLQYLKFYFKQVQLKWICV